MLLGYRLYRCNAEGKVTHSLVISPDGKFFVYNDKGDTNLVLGEELSVEVRSVREIASIAAKLCALGAQKLNYGVANKLIESGELRGDNGDFSLSIGFRLDKNDYYTVVLPEANVYGEVSTLIMPTVDLTVVVKRKTDLEMIRHKLSRYFGFKDFTKNV